MRLASVLTRRPLDALVVLLAAVAEVKIWISPGTGPRTVFIVGTLLWTLPLLLRRRFPFAAPVFAFAMQTGVAFADPDLGVETTMSLAWLLTFWVVGAYNERRQAIVGALIGFASIIVIARQDVRVGLDEVIWGIVFGGAICLIAYALQRRTARAAELEERAARLEREREERTRAAVEAERRRIARELHDVIAHTVSVMTIQAGAARLLLDDDPERAVGPLISVEETGRQALTEIRRLFEVTREHADDVPFGPRPGIANLDALVDHARRAGLPVELAVEGEPVTLSPGLELAAYRVVQEALTNSLKHAGRTTARVGVRYGRDALDLEIVDRGRGPTRREGTGHGLIGMRERVALYGGELEAEPRTEGGFVVRARLPVERTQP
jgi:signal transduction histidine kinase